MSNPFDQFDSSDSSANPFDQFDQAPKKKSAGILGDLKDTLVEGTKSAGRAIAGTANIYTGDEAGLVDKAKAQEAATKPAALQGFYDEVKNRVTPLGEDPGLVDSVKAVGGAVLNKPYGAGLAVVEQLPNSAPALAGGFAGMKAGAALGSAVAPGVGTVVGGIAGGLAGMFLGNSAIETGYKGIEAAHDGRVTPEEFSRVKKEGAVKSGVITAIDGATLGLSNAVVGTTRRAVESATRRALTKAGVDIADNAAVLAARQSPEISAAVRSAQESAYTAANTIGKRAATGGAAMGLETVGEGLGEYFGELAATGRANVADAVLEGLMSLGQSGAEVAWGAARNKEQNKANTWDAVPKPEPVITADPVPLQQRIDAMMGIDNEAMDDKARAQYEKDLTAAFLEPIGTTNDANGLEIPFTMADYLSAQVRAEDESRARPLRQQAIQEADARLQQIADEEQAQQPDISPAARGIAAPPVIPVVGPLSAAANLAVQSGAHQATVMQQAAAQAAKNEPQPEAKAGTPAGAQSNAAAPAQGPLSSVAEQATTTQLNWLVQRGKNGNKEAAVAELQRRGVQIDNPAPANTDAIAPEESANPDQKKADSASVPELNAANSANGQQAEAGLPASTAGESRPAPAADGEELGAVFRDWVAKNDRRVSAYPSDEQMAAYQREANNVLAGKGQLTSKDDFERFMRLRAYGKKFGFDLSATYTAFDNGQDIGPDGGLKIKSTSNQNPIKNESPSAATVPAETVAPSQEPIKNEDDWLGALFGAAPTAAESASKEVQTNRQAQDKADRVDSAIAMLTGEIEASNAAAAEVAARNYKSNRKQIELKGDGPGKNGSLSISAINESRKRRTVEALQNASSSIKQAIEFIAENPDAAFKQVADMEAAVTKQFNEGFFGPSAKLDGQLDMAVGSLIGSGSYSGEGSAGRKLRMAAHAYASADAVSQPKTDAAPEAKQDKAPASDADTRFAKNTIFTADRVAAAKARMKAKLGTMNSGIDPELLIDGMTIAGAYIESGVRKFSDYAKAMVEDLGDGVKPYLLSFYEAARAYPGLNKMGMDSAEAAASQHQALLTPEVKEAAKEVIGETPKVEKKKPASLGESIKLKADWGVQNIDGYTASRTGKNQQTDYGLKGGVKDEFLNDASRYLKAVEKLLQEKGFSSGLDRKGKPAKAVSINEGGPAVGGDVYLEMSAGDFHVYAQVGVTNVRGMGPEHPQGVSLMVRAGQKNSMNNWLATDLTAGDLAAWFDKQHQAFAKRSAEVKPAAPAKTSYDLSKADDKFKVATEIADFLIGGGEFKTIIEARKKISEMIGRPIEAATELAKQADETIETAVVLAGRDIVKAGRKQGRSAEVIYDRLVDLYRRQPNLAVRSSTSVRDQAYSTPVPLAYLASELAGITYDTKVLEPTAGNGMLLIGASIGNAVANELNPDRAGVLRSIGFNPTERNAATEQLRHAGYPVDAVIANPPFGATKDANGETIVYDIKPGFQTREVDHAIVFKSLETMKDDGRAVLIVGGVQSEEEEFRREDYRGKNKRTFYYNLYNEYNVIDHFTADGGLYSKQGASYPVDIIVIDGRGKSSRDLPAADLPVIFKSYDALKEKLNGNGRMESKPVVGANGTDSGNGQAGQGNAPGLAGSPVGSSVKDGDGSASGVSAGGVRNDGLADNGRPIGSGAVSSGGQSESANASGSVDGVRVSDANRNAEVGSKAGNRGNRPDDLGGISVVNGERVESGLTDRRGQEQETGHQVAYDPHSNAASVGTLVPRAMKDSIAASLQKISDEVGSIDDYVAESLAMDLEDVKANFSAEQIDALALAIRNAEAGKGFIIGDQTGIGKGRVVAAMIRYALVTGKTPIFVTEKPNLYSDMIRDLDDIGMTAELALDTKNPKVMITNGGESIPYTLLRTENGEVVENNLLLRAPKSGKALDQIMQGMMDGDSLGEYKVIFTTYSQLQTVKGATTTRQKFIQRFGEGNYMVFDESHNAGGAGDTQARTKEQRQAAKDGESLVTGRASFVRHLVQKAFGTFFSSATYAKRPDVMDLYSSTNMKLAVDKISQLGEAIKSGGVPMQQVVANMLTKDGQYIRRERTFAGVSYDTQETKVDKGTAENMASAMRSILAFSRAKDSVIKEIQKEMDREGGMINEMGGEKSSVQGANFGSIMHNLIDQMLLSLKVQDSVAHAIERLKAGEKVVLTVSNTMGSFLKDYSEELGIATGDPVSMSFADLYNRYLEKQRNVTIKDGGGNKRQHRLTDAELGPRLVDMFNAVRKQIESSGFGSAPISPIDYMHNELRKAGYKTDEITGRTIALNYSSGTPILASRTANIRQRVKAVSGFNNGETDVLILNQAGSTGLSLHASSKFKDQRKRHMIIVQAEKNIDTHMQMLGRVHRTGQVVAPAYSQMMADIPAEMRPASVLMKKMASLNANTTASRTSSVTAEGVVDFMNNYGGQVVHEYLRDNPDVLESVGGSKVIALGDDPAEAGEDDIRKFTGYIPILPIKQQEEVYRELVDRYNELIERENSLGTNKLEAKAVDLDAETISSQTVTEDRGDPSVFASPANMEKVDVKRTVKPFSSEEVAAMVLERLGGSAANIIASKQSTELYELAMAYSKEKIAKLLADGVDPVKVESQKAQLQLVLSHARTVLSTYKIGDSISVKDQIGQFVYGVITNIERSGRTANPAAGSAWKMHIALANGDAKSITINFSQIGSKYELRGENRVEWYNTDTQSVERITVYDIFDKGAKVRREKRWIVTGNILAGFARFPGQIITYTKNDGTTAQGVLMSRQFDFEKEQKNAPVRIKDGKSAIKFFTNGGQGGIIGTPDRFLMIAPRRGEFEITVPSSKKDGGTYYLDTGLTNIVGDFYKRGSIMSASVYTTGDVERVVDYLVKGREETIIALSNVEKAKELLEGNTGSGNIAAPGSMSPADKAIYGMAAEGKSAADILKFIASASRNPFYRQLAKLLMKTGIAPSITVGDGKGWKFNAGEGNKYAAGYNPKSNTISLFRPASAERNMLHELTHAATLKALSGKGMAAAQMKALYQHVKKSGKLKGMYGMSDVDEFIAEAFSNPKFQEQLKKVAAPKASAGTLSSAWNWFVRIVRGILGVSANEENALAQALEIGVDVMRENMGAATPNTQTGYAGARSSKMQERPSVRAVTGSMAEPAQLKVGDGGSGNAIAIPDAVQASAIKAAQKVQDESNSFDLEEEINSVSENGEADLSSLIANPKYWDAENEEFTDEGYKQVDLLNEQKARDNLRLLSITELSDLDSAYHKAQYAAMVSILDGIGIPYKDTSSNSSKYLEVGRLKLRFSNHANTTRSVMAQVSNMDEVTSLINVAPGEYKFSEAIDAVMREMSSAGSGAIRYAKGDGKPSATNEIKDTIQAWTSKKVADAAPEMERARALRDLNAALADKNMPYEDAHKLAFNLKAKATKYAPPSGNLNFSQEGSALVKQLRAASPEAQAKSAVDFIIENGTMTAGRFVFSYDNAAKFKRIEVETTTGGYVGSLDPDFAHLDIVEMMIDEPGLSALIRKATAVSAGSDAIRYATGPKQTESEAFRKWFGDSKVVDENGDPLVVYHGTGATDISEFKVSNGGTYGGGIYLTPEVRGANDYAIYRGAPSSTVYPVYASIKNPASGAEAAQVASWKGEENAREELIKRGYDGVVDMRNGEIVAFYPEQIKSAIGNNGDFDGSNPDIRYNVADEGWSVSEPSKMDDLIYSLQDKQIDLKRVVQSIMQTGKKVKDEINAYLQEELFHGRAAKGVKDFLDLELRPLLADMQKSGVDMGDFEEYLWNRHAEERNAQIAKINKDMPDGGSGIETAAARAYLAGLPAERRRAFESMAAKVEAMNRNSQRVLVESGLEKQSTIDAWNGAYKHYVPLQREDVDTGHVGTGKGFSVRGSSTKRAMGSGKAVVDIIANLTMQRERNIVRAEKNRVSNALLGLAIENPNPEFWKVDQAPKERVVEETAIYTVLDANGKKIDEFTRMSDAERLANKTPGSTIDQSWGDRVNERITPGFKNRDNVILTRINGEDHYIILNERDERAMRLSASMKNLDMDNMGRALSIVGKATRYLASVNTQYNPVFGVINLIRDVQGALLNLQSTQLAGEQKRVAGYTVDALRGIYADIRAHRAGKVPSSNWAKLFEEFQKEGGQTGYRDQYANAEARAEAIVSELKQFNEGKPKRMARAVFRWLSDYNETMENAVRLAAYKTAKEKGLSNQQAASIAKNLTVNFNRKGQMTTQIGALYAFFNASVQGTARLAETLFEKNDGDPKKIRLSKLGKQIITGGIMLGSMQALLLAAAGFDDDEPPEFIRERNLILPIGDGKYLTLAMPLGFHVIPGIGRIATEFALSGFKDPAKRTVSMLGMFAETFNPIGSAGLSIQTLTPSVVDPFAALAENRDFTGREIYRENFNANDPSPGHARAKDVATVWSRYISEAINFVTGGTEFKPGAFSPSPDAIDYLIAQATGGVGREVNKVGQTAGAAYTGDDLPLYKIPLVGRFIGDTEGQSGHSQKFYNAVREINLHEREIKGLREAGRIDEAREYMAENPVYRMSMMANSTERQVRKLRDVRRAASESGDADKVREINDQITNLMSRFNERTAPLLEQ